jgi:hypothetical protein
MLSSFVMLNLVVGVVCSSMTEARTNHDLRKKKEARIATISRTSGVEMQVRFSGLWPTLNHPVLALN